MPVNQVFDYLPRKSDKTKQVNFTIAIYICREYLRNKRNLSPPDVINLIEKHVLPVRPGRKNPRKVKPQASVYVLTAEPLPQTFVSGGELSGRWNALFCAARDEHFTQAASFDMGNGTVFTVWERTEPADRAEVEYYLDAFAQEDALYPEMFSQVAEAWLAGHGL